MKDIGRSGLIFRGAYDPSKQYEILDMVYQDGGCYICTSEAPVTGLMPKEHPEKWGIAAKSASLIDREAAQAAAQSAAQDRQAAETAKAVAQAAAGAALGAKDAAASAKNTAVTKAREASKSATEAAQSAQAARQAAESVDGAALMAAVKGKVSKAGDTMTGALDAPEFKEGGVKLGDKYAAKAHNHQRSQITDFPSSMPASDVYPWAKQATKPAYGPDEISGLKGWILNLCYPVGSIWQSTSADSPASIIGGTWEAVEGGRFLVAVGNDYTVGQTGGDTTHKHGLGSGAAAININGTGIRACQKSASFTMNAYKGSSSIENFPQGEGTGVALVGTTDSADNRPPYYAVYMFRRIA